ncbi:hypothetical protein J6590_042549 [Homalodisca vitripennis]|nr:hypothetical protein J6590_042549 [Homalodisca vitripennis]
MKYIAKFSKKVILKSTDYSSVNLSELIVERLPRKQEASPRRSDLRPPEGTDQPTPLKTHYVVAEGLVVSVPLRVASGIYFFLYDMKCFTFEEYADIHFVCGLAGGNARLANRLYRERFPDRLHPVHSVFSAVHIRLRETGHLKNNAVERDKIRTDC